MTVPALAPPQRPQSAQAYEYLAEGIGTCRILPGSRIHERTVAQLIGMSRTPVREAIRRLELDGLVVVVPRQGTIVAHLDATDIEENMALREALEVGMAGRLVAERQRIDLHSLEELIGQQITAIEAGATCEFLALDEDFHRRLVRMAGNRRAEEEVLRSMVHVNRARYLVPLDEDHMRAAVADHREILGALGARDLDRLRYAYRRHLGAPLRAQLDEIRRRNPGAFLDPR